MCSDVDIQPYGCGGRNILTDVKAMQAAELWTAMALTVWDRRVLLTKEQRFWEMIEKPNTFSYLFEICDISKDRLNYTEWFYWMLYTSNIFLVTSSIQL